MSTSENNLATAASYYQAMRNKDVTALSGHLHPDVSLLLPLAELSGKPAVVDAAARLMGLLLGLEIHAKFAVGDQVTLSYHIDFPEPIGLCRAASLMTFRDGLISRIELYYDARPFEKSLKKDAIFASAGPTNAASRR